MSDSILILAFLTFSLMCGIANSMRFQLKYGDTKCISDEIKSNSMTVGNYTVVNPNRGYPIPETHKLIVKVVSPHGNNYHHGDNVESGNFAFTAAEAGDYSTCFRLPDSRAMPTVTVEFDWKSGVAAKDWSKVAKKGQVDVMEFELKRMYDTILSIHDEMFYLRGREVEMQELNKATNTKMFTFSFFSLVLCLSVVALQLWHLKTFFARKKLL
ncbi:unnamed protein product [Lupinus luteus]|uniref:GOLD domain-containing protein n=1 Tax=Lupinus luteus TaxID=3873 RepID=A0AAV1X825_LUPLU